MRTHRRDAGFSLSALIFFATAASIVIASVAPAYRMQAQRQMEQELIFRGEEYTRAIQKYQRRFGVYPSSIDQLLSTNGLRFLRRKYEDPITGKEFRLISINPDGSLQGSKLWVQGISSQPLFGDVQPFGQQQNPQQPGQRGAQQGGQQQPQTFQTQGQPGAGLNRGNQPTPFGAQPNQFGNQQNNLQFGSQPNNLQFGSQPNQLGNQPNQSFQQGQPQRVGGGVLPNSSSPTPVGGGGIIGVASSSEEASIIVYNKRQRYDEWEFIAILGQQGPQGVPGQNPQQQPNLFPQGPGAPGQNPQFNQPGTGPRGNSPFPNNPNSPFGGAPTGSPFGPQPGQGGQIQNPFGFGGPTQPNQPNQPRK